MKNQKEIILTCALLSQSAYYSSEQYIPNGWKLIENFIDTMSKEEFEKTKKDVRISIYYNHEKHQAIIACRGTLINNAEDLKKDLQIFLGNNPNLEQELIFIKNALAKISGWGFWYNYGLFKGRWNAPEIIFTGHSLGANLATNLALRYNSKAIVFDSSGIPDTSVDLTNQDKIITILGKPNFVNCAGKQVGTIYYFPKFEERSTPVKSVVYDSITNNKDTIIDTAVDFGAKVVGFFPSQKTKVFASVASSPPTQASLKTGTKSLIKLVFENSDVQKVQETISNHPISHFVRAIQSNLEYHSVSKWPKFDEYREKSEKSIQEWLENVKANLQNGSKFN